MCAIEEDRCRRLRRIPPLLPICDRRVLHFRQVDAVFGRRQWRRAPVAGQQQSVGQEPDALAEIVVAAKREIGADSVDHVQTGGADPREIRSRFARSTHHHQGHRPLDRPRTQPVEPGHAVQLAMQTKDEHRAPAKAPSSSNESCSSVCTRTRDTPSTSRSGGSTVRARFSANRSVSACDSSAMRWPPDSPGETLAAGHFRPGPHVPVVVVEDVLGQLRGRSDEAIRLAPSFRCSRRSGERATAC